MLFWERTSWRPRTWSAWRETGPRGERNWGGVRRSRGRCAFSGRPTLAVTKPGLGRALLPMVNGTHTDTHRRLFFFGGAGKVRAPHIHTQSEPEIKSGRRRDRDLGFTLSTRAPCTCCFPKTSTAPSVPSDQPLVRPLFRSKRPHRRCSAVLAKNCQAAGERGRSNPRR